MVSLFFRGNIATEMLISQFEDYKSTILQEVMDNKINQKGNGDIKFRFSAPNRVKGSLDVIEH